MALLQSKIIQKRITDETIEKNVLAKKLHCTLAKINEYILGDDVPPEGIELLPQKNGFVKVIYSKEVEVPKYEGVHYNLLQNGDKTFYITYKDIESNKKLWLKIGKASQGITEPYCVKKRNELLQQIRVGETPTQIKNKRVMKLIKTLDMVAEEYHKDRSLEMTKRNLQYSKSIYANHIQPFLGEMDITKITPNDITEIIRAKKDDYAVRTINTMIEKVSSIFNFAIKNGMYKDINPVIGVKKLKGDNERTRFLSLEEIRELIEAVKGNEILYLFVVLSLSTGGRLKTICNIKIKDINLDTMFIELRDFKNRTSYKGFIKEDPQFLSILKKHMDNKDAVEFLLGRQTLVANVRYVERSLPILLNKLFNQHIDEDKENLTAEELAENRREKVVIHTLRHTFASQLVINGTPIYTVKERMNHRDIKQTMRYAKLAPDSGRSNINNLF
jgi:integrase